MPLHPLPLLVCTLWVGWKLARALQWWHGELLGDPLAREFRREQQRRLRASNRTGDRRPLGTGGG